jgi:hypothetical protein
VEVSENQSDCHYQQYLIVTINNISRNRLIQLDDNKDKLVQEDEK